VAEMVRVGGLKNSRRVRAPQHLCQYHTFAVCQYCITIECVGVTVEAQAQKVYQ